jgi:hypothetical protein
MVSNLVVGVFEGFERLVGATVVKPRSTKPYRSGAKYGTNGNYCTSTYLCA